MPINTVIDLVVINKDPRRAPRCIRLPISGAAGIILAITALVGWLGFVVTRSWDQRELRSELADQGILMADICRLLPGVSLAKRALYQARESKDLAGIVFGLPIANPNTKSAGREEQETPCALESKIYETNRQAELEIQSITQTVAAINSKLIRHTPLASPVSGRITSRFGMRRHPIFGSLFFHYGVDIAGTRGTSVKAPAAGRVLSIGYSARSGRFLRIDHGYGYTSLYTHLDRIYVRTRQRILRGQTIAALGNTGLTTGPHLHYEVHWNGRPVDPEPYLAGRVADRRPAHAETGVLYFNNQCLQAVRQKPDSSSMWPWSSG